MHYAVSHVNDILEILKSKIYFFLIFDLKTIIFPPDDAEVFIFQYLVLNILSNICKVICKKHEGGSDKYEIWYVEQLDRAEKKNSK